MSRAPLETFSIERLRRFGRRAVGQAVADALTWVPALFFAIAVRFNFALHEVDWVGFAVILPLAWLGQFFSGLASGLYLARWRYGSFDEIAALVRATSINTALLFALDLWVATPHMVPLSVTLGGGVAALSLMAAIRYTWRLTLERRLRPSGDQLERVIVFGAGEGGAQVVAAMLRDRESPFLPVALLDDDPAKRNLRISGVPVAGTRNDITSARDLYDAAALVIALPTATPDVVTELAEAANSAGLRVLTLPPLNHLLGSVGVRDIHAIDSPEALGPVAFAAPDVTEDDVEAVVGVLRSGWLTTGDVCAGLEGDLSEYLDAPHVIAVASCTAALEIAFAGLDLPPNSRVGVPTWTFASTGLAASRYGAVPVLLDVDADTLNLSADSLEAAMASGLDAIIPVHFGGVPVDPKIHKLAAEADLKVVEDAAHALGAEDNRGRIGGGGSFATCFSFYATKNLTAGEGGALATTDDALAEFARSYRIHGMSRDAIARYQPGATAGYDLHSPGIKANLPDLLAALARSQLSRYSDMQSKRRHLVALYRDLLAKIDGITLIPKDPVEGSADHLMVVLLPEEVKRELVMAELSRQGVSTSVHFRPLHTFSWFRDHAVVGPSGVATADRLAPRTLSLPLHSGLRAEQVEAVCSVLASLV